MNFVEDLSFLAEIAKITSGYVGADLAQVC